MENPENAKPVEHTQADPDTDVAADVTADVSSDVPADSLPGTETGTTTGIPEVGPDSISWSDTNGIFIAEPTPRKVPTLGIFFWIAFLLLGILFLVYPYIDSMIDYGPYSKPEIGQLYLFFPLGIVIITFVASMFEKLGWLVPIVAVVFFFIKTLIFDFPAADQAWGFAVGYLILGAFAWLFGLVFKRNREIKSHRI